LLAPLGATGIAVLQGGEDVNSHGNSVLYSRLSACPAVYEQQVGLQLLHKLNGIPLVYA
jgi:hypothetical protein